MGHGFDAVIGLRKRKETNQDVTVCTHRQKVRNLDLKTENLGQLSCVHIFGPAAKKSCANLDRLQIILQAEHSAGSPRTDLLLHLVQLNIRRAFLANVDLLGLDPAIMDDEAISMFCTTGSWFTEMQNQRLPTNLLPTEIQQRIIHHPWLDLIPSPKTTR